MEAFRLLEKQGCTIRDSFWSRYISLVKNTVIPYQWDILNDRIPDSEPSHASDNFRVAAGDMEGRFYGQVFQDSDVSKWLEAVGNVLMLERDKELEEKADSVIDIIARAQQPDGYLDTYFIIEEPDKRWTNVLECHELYCAGHFIEGAVAYYLATGKEKVYNVAKKLADHIDGVFGPEERWRRMGYTRAPLGLALRIPGWSRGYSLRVNGETVSADREEKGFACLMRSWPEETEITLKFRMEARFIKASQNVRYNAGRAAIVRGPLVYCLEEADNGAYLDQIAVDPKGGLAEEADLSMPGGCIALKARGVRELAQTDADTLYMPYGSYEEAVTVKAVPYFLRNNRGRGEMQVWMRIK